MMTKLSQDLLSQIAEKIFEYESDDAMFIFELHEAEVVGDTAVFVGYLVDLNSSSDDYAALRVMLSKGSLLYEAKMNGKTVSGEIVSGGNEAPFGEDV